MNHTLTIYGKNVRVVVQTKGLNTKAASEVAAHFSKTISQALLDAPHVGVMREHQLIEVDTDLLEKVPAPEPEPAAETLQPAPEAPTAAKKAAKKAPKKGIRGFYRP